MRRGFTGPGSGSLFEDAAVGVANHEIGSVEDRREVDLGPPDHAPISLADGPILGFTALMGTTMWGFAERRKIALGFGGALGVALVLKPFVMPFVTYFSSASERARVITDPDTLSIVGPGIALVITALVVGLKK